MMTPASPLRPRPPHTARRPGPVARGLIALLALGLLAGACSDDEAPIAGGGDVQFDDPGDCVVVDMSVSSEKVELLNALARTFNESDQKTRAGECIFVRPQNKASGRATSLLA